MLRQLSYEPENILDPSFAPDLSKIDGILSFGDQALVARIVNDAIKGIPIPFGMLSQNINLNNLHEFNEQDLLSALIYFGFLTYTGEGNALKIPNKAVARQFFSYYLVYLQGMSNFTLSKSDLTSGVLFLQRWDAKPFVQAVSARLSGISGKNSSLHLRENGVVIALGYAGSFCDEYFDSKLEYEIRGVESGYADLVLLPKSDHVRYSYIFEVKYLPKSKGSQKNVAKALTLAKEQVKRYALGEEIRNLPGLRRVACVFVGTELKAFESSETA